MLLIRFDCALYSLHLKDFWCFNVLFYFFASFYAYLRCNYLIITLLCIATVEALLSSVVWFLFSRILLGSVLTGNSVIKIAVSLQFS